MAAYLIADTLLTDPVLYEEYKRQVKPLAETFGGEYVARGGALMVKESQLWSPTRVVVVRFASMDDANRFYESDEYQRLLGISRQAARRTVLIVEGS